MYKRIRPAAGVTAGSPRTLRILQRAFVGRFTSGALVVLAGLVLVQTDTQGLVGVLVVLAASSTAIRSGRWAGVLLAGAGGLVFIAVSAWQGRATGVGLVLTGVAVLLWTVIACVAEMTATDLRRRGEARADQVHELTHRALHDPLTGLVNRELLLDRIGAALQRADHDHTHVAVLLLNLDNFTAINDSLGHAVGDHLLADVGRRLSEQLCGTDTAARFGGDEFVMVCGDLRDDQEPIRIADRVIAALRPPFTVEDRDVAITASIGIAVPSSAAHGAHQLLRDAGQAMGRAKQRGGGRFEVFNDVLRNRATHRLNTESNLRRAVERDELRLIYQPIIDLTENRISGVEALLRWNHPTRGLLAPVDFLAVAEGSSLIVSIGAWVLDQACTQATKWHVSSPRLTMAINVSLRQLSSGSLDATLTQALNHSGVNPSGIHLEITETALRQANPAMKNQLSMITARGVSLGLDDFGTGYSSRSLIEDFPVRFLKIDRSFTSGLGEDANDTAVTSAVLGLGRQFGLSTIAEGIETPDQLSRLRQLGCRYGQGYHLARPQSAAHIQRLLTQTGAWHPANT